MANPLDDFWKLFVASGLLAAAECDDLKSAYARVPGADQENTKALCGWLIERGMLSRYQARLLLAGRPGPFFFGDYRVYDRVETGRLKGLFRASHRETGDQVLLYFFAGAATQDLRKWLPVEARSQLAVGVKHPNVSRVDALVQADGYKFLVIEGLDGKSLEELAGGKPLPMADVCRYLRKAVTGLARLHSLKQIHADIRPDTLWLENTGQLKLLYFPLSRDPLGPAAALSPPNADYLAPECVLPGGKSPDERSDIYSLGCTAYCLLSGQVPYPGGDAADKARRHASEDCTPLDQLAGLPSQLSNFVASMMAKDSQARPATAAQVADELVALTSIVDGAAKATSGASKPAKPNGQTPAPKPREPSPAVPATSAQRPAPKPPEATPRPVGATANPRSAPATGTAVAGTRTAAKPTKPAAAPVTAKAKPVAPPPAERQAAPPPAPANVPPPPPPQVQSVGAPQMNGWPAMPPGQEAISMPPVVAQATGVAPPPPPPSGFAPQYPGFAPQAAPVMGFPVASAPMGMPVMEAPAYAPQGYVPQGYAPQGYAPQEYGVPDYAAPMPQAYAAPHHEEAPLVGASRQPAAFDSAVMNVLDNAAASPAPRPAANGTARAASPSPARRVRQQQKGLSPQTIGLGIGALVIVLVGVGALVLSRGGGEVPSGVDLVEKPNTDKPNPPPDPEPDDKGMTPDEPPVTKEEAKVKPPKPPKESGPEIVEDDGKSLWVSPTSGPPIDVQYLPPGTQALLVLRPHDLLTSTAEGDKVLAALGPGGAWARTQIESICGVGLADMEQLIVAFSSLAKGAPQAAFVVRLSQPRPAEELMTAWGNPAAATDGKAYFTGSNWAYYVPPAGENKIVVVCGAKEMADVVDMDGPPPMRKEMEKLLRQTDAKRHFTLLVAPNYLETDGKSLLDGALERLRNPLTGLFGAGVQAATLSFHFGQDFFTELRLYSTDVGPAELARQTREQLGKVPDQIEMYIANLSPHPYGKLVLGRFSQMLRVADEYVRVGEEENQALLNCMLPLSAGHNLIMGTELALFERGAGGEVVAKAGTPTTPAEALKQKITLSFSRDTLEKTMEMVAREINWEIVIIGTDLQLEGITKNQSFGLDEKDKPALEVLQTVMMKANPDGKLIYVYKPKNPGEKDIIYITTRASAEKNGYKVPPELAKAAGDKPKAKK